MTHSTYQLPKTLPTFIWDFLKPYKAMVGIFVSTAILAGFFGPFNNILIKNIINTLPQLNRQDLSPLTCPAILLVLNFIIFDNFTWRSINYMNCRVQPLIKNQLMGLHFGHFKVTELIGKQWIPLHLSLI